MSSVDFSLRKQSPLAGGMGAGLNSVFDYWSVLRADKLMPAWSDFDWMCLPVVVIPWCAVVDVARDPLDFIYRFWGTARTNLQGHDYTGVSIRDVEPSNVAEKIFGEYSLIVENREPIYFTTSSQPDGLGNKFEYHFLRLPFGDNDQTVSQILSVGMYEESDIKMIQDFFGTTS